MLAIDHDRAFIGNFALIGVRLLGLSALLQFNLLNCPWDNLLNELVGLTIFHLFIVRFSLIRQDNIALLWTSSILYGVAASYALSVLYHMMFRCGILHMNQSASWRNLLGIEKLRLWLIIIFVLEGIEKVLGSVLWSLKILHLLPDVLDIQVHYFFLVFCWDVLTWVADLLHVSGRIYYFLYSLLYGLLLLLNIHNVWVVIRAAQVNLCNQGLGRVGRLFEFLGRRILSLSRDINWRSHWLSSRFCCRFVLLCFLKRRHDFWLHLVFFSVKINLGINSFLRFW